MTERPDVVRAFRLALLASPQTLGVTSGSVALATAQRDLGQSATNAAMLIIFGAGVAVGTPLGGRVIRTFGARACLIAGAVGSGVGAAGLLLLPDTIGPLAGRGLIGLAAGFLTTSAFAAAGTGSHSDHAFAVLSAVMNGIEPLAAGLVEPPVGTARLRRPRRCRKEYWW